MTQPETAAQTLEVALQRHKAGNIAQAESLYRQVLAKEPNNARALNYLGVLAAQVGRTDAAIPLFQRAIALTPWVPELHNNLATAFKDRGNNAEAIESYRRALRLNPNYGEAQVNLANALKDAGEIDAALAQCRQALSLRPDDPSAHSVMGDIFDRQGDLTSALAEYQEAVRLNPTALVWNNLGGVLGRQKRFEEALQSFRQALELAPDAYNIQANVGTALMGLERYDQAVIALGRAIQLNPKYTAAYGHLGVALGKLDRHEDAVAVLREAVRLDAGGGNYHYNLGFSLAKIDRFEEAVEEYRKDLHLRPDHADAHNNLGSALGMLRQYDEAIAEMRHALALAPDVAHTHMNLGMYLLLTGNFEQGWDEFQYRWETGDLDVHKRDFREPQWNGEPLAGTTLLLFHEQGLGDTIQFVRYAPILAAQGARVVVWATDELARLVGGMPGIAVVPAGGVPPRFDRYCHLLNLPRILRTRLETIPANVPYLTADERLAAEWADRLGRRTQALRVGLVWGGSPGHKNDKNRSLSLSTLAPLAAVEKIQFYSLQKGPAAAQAAHAPPELRLIDPAADLHDFADTAALVSQLDLVISADTSVAHLAGAMGKPVWILLTLKPDWRWLLEREDSPWYPTARLFRQKIAGDWNEVIERVAAALAEFRPADGKGTP